jgi:tripartite-type tricarboxylate transporter receptor subunit TctC
MALQLNALDAFALMNRSRRTTHVVFCGLFVLLGFANASAQTAAPTNALFLNANKPIKMVVGYSAGGAVDLVARALSRSLATQMGMSFVVENKPGAGTNIAVKSVIAAEPDGHTLMLAANALAANMSLYQPAPFDAEKELATVALVGKIPVVIAVQSNSNFRGMSALIEKAKSDPQSLSYASPGNGSTPHLAMEIFARAASIDLSHIPYKGGAQAITDVLGGQVPVLAMNALEVLPHVSSGKLKVLAVLSAKRTPMFPDALTLSEQGFPGFEAAVWYGVVAPSATPKNILVHLHQEVQKALASAEVKEKMNSVGGEVTLATREQFAELLHAERVRYEKLIRQAQIKPD